MKQRFLALCLSLVSVVIMAAQGKATSENIDDPEGTNHALKVTTSEPKENIWDWQIHYKLDAPLTKGKTYVLTMRAKGSGDGTFALWPIDTASENKNQWGAVMMYSMRQNMASHLYGKPIHGILRQDSL